MGLGHDLRRAFVPVGAIGLLLIASPLLAQKRDKQKPIEDVDTYCASLAEKTRRQTEICKTPEEQREDAQAKRRKEAEEKEKPTHTSFLRKFHLDGMWIPTSMGSGEYGIIGTHLDVASVGRVHLFGPPGMMLVVVNTEEGWKLRPALTYGVSVYLTDFHFGTTHRAQLYFNLAKTWSAGNLQTGRDLAGLSLSFKK